MKNIQKIVGVMLLLMAFSACESVLDQVPSDKVSVDRLLNKATIKGFRDRSYDNLPKSFTAHSSACLLEAYSDDAFKAGSSAATFDWHSGFLSPSTPLIGSAIWTSCWTGIRRCNLALEYLPQSTAPQDVVDDASLARWIDEVRLLRAWYHFLLIKNFGPIPFTEEAYSPTFEGWASLTRPSYDEISTRIVAECDLVIDRNNLPLRWVESGDIKNVNKAFAFALKSRVLLYNASELNNPTMDNSKWLAAADAAKACIDSIMSEYSLLDMADYATLFSDASTVSNSEVILRSSQNDAGTLNSANGVDLYYYGSTAQSGNCGAVPTQELVDCFELTNGNLPVSYGNADHTSVTYNAGYSEAEGDDPYLSRDERFYHSILFNGATYGYMDGPSDTDPELVVYTYGGKSGSGFNTLPLSQEEADKRRSCTGYYARKFRSASYWGATAGGTNSNKIYFRLAEVYLNLAEANCEAGNLPDALKALNVVRNRADQPSLEDVSDFENTKEYLRARIRNERRVELCFEGHRFYDQRRWNILDETNGVVTGMKVTSDNGFSSGTFSYERVKLDVSREAVGDKYLVLPLSLDEARKLTGIGQPEAWQ